MPKTIAYIRASTDKQDLKNQKLEIFEYARRNQLEVNDFIQITISSRRTSKDIATLMKYCWPWMVKPDLSSQN